MTAQISLRSNRGFTLIELLVVVVIIGILAAIALPSLLGQTNKARTTEATSVVSGINQGQEAFYYDNKVYINEGVVTRPSNMISPPSTTQALPPVTSGTILVNTPATISLMVTDLGVNISNANWQYATTGNATSWMAAGIGSQAPMINLGVYTEKGLFKMLLDGDSTQ